MITITEIEKAQKKWGDSLVKIGSLKSKPMDCKEFTTQVLNELYAFDSGEILFKPTKATDIAFRSNFEGALSYFIGSNENFPEDQGFAINPWTKVEFENKITSCDENSALAMGYYHFTDLDNNITTVEYTFGYILVNSNLKINLHHSSLPYKK